MNEYQVRIRVRVRGLFLSYSHKTTTEHCVKSKYLNFKGILHP